MNALPLRARELSPPALIAALKSLAPLLIGLAMAYILQTYIKSHYLNGFRSKVLTDIGINVILAVSLNMVNGFTGQFSIGHAGFMAIGGYTAGAITYYGSYRMWGDSLFHGGFLSWALENEQFTGVTVAPGDLLFVSGCIAGGLIAAIAGYLVGLPSLRLRGDYLAIVTLGFGEILRVILQRTDDVLYTADEIREASIPTLATHLGGALGFTGIPYYTSLFWVYAFVVITLLVAYRLKQSTHGRAFISIREDEIAAESMGVFTTRYKVRAFVIAAFFAGIAGGLFAHEVGTSINPRELGFQKSFDIVIMVVLGGMGSITGSVLAAILLTVLPEMLRDPPHVWQYGAWAAAIVILASIVLRNRPWKSVAGIAAAVIIWEGLRAIALSYAIDLGQYRMVIYALSLILIMILRPQGLLGISEIWDIGRRFIRRSPTVKTS